jgi:hypothetical protein
MSKPPEGREPWWTTRGRRAVSVVRLDERCLGLRVRLASGERVTMPLGPMTFKIR